MNSHEHPYVVGHLYSRRGDIHKRFRGQMQGGISTPAEAPFVFLFTGESGEAYGYEDSFGRDGTFWYTGEGQVGDMDMVRGNAAIVSHHEQRKHVLLFEYVAKDSVRFIGEVEYLDHHTVERRDRDGKQRCGFRKFWPAFSGNFGLP
jgi:5-methylcytosine-specific restriction protein A